MENLIININEILTDIDIADNQFMQNVILEKNYKLFKDFNTNFTSLMQHFLFDNEINNIDLNYIIENGISNTYTNKDYSSTLFYHNIYLILKNINVFNSTSSLNTIFSTIISNLMECEKSFLYLLSNDLGAKNIFLACNYLKHKISFVLAIKKNNLLKNNSTYSEIINTFKNSQYFKTMISNIFNTTTTPCLDAFFNMNEYKFDNCYSYSNFHTLLHNADSLIVLVSFDKEEQQLLKNFITTNYLEKTINDEIDEFNIEIEEEKETCLVPYKKISFFQKFVDRIRTIFKQTAY